MSIKENVNDLLKKIGLKAEEIKLEQMKLSDGVTVVEAEAFEVGQPIFVVAEDQTIALPVGEYTLEDGRVLGVEVEGVIASVNEPQPEAEVEVEVEQPMEEPAMEMEAEAPAKKVVESIVKETYFAKIEEQEKQITELRAMIEEMKAAKEEVKEEVELSAIEEEVKPIVHNPESGVEVKPFKYGNAQGSTLDRVFSHINKK